MYVCMVIIFSKGKDQQGNVANPAARGQVNRENDFFPRSLYLDDSCFVQNSLFHACTW